jgi:amidase
MSFHLQDQMMSRRRALTLLAAGALAPIGGCKREQRSNRAAIATASGEGVHYHTLHDVASRLAAREVSPVDLTQRTLERIGTLDPTLKSYATAMFDEARSAALAAEREIEAGRYRGPLHGVPIAVKDLCYTKGVRTMGGSAVLKDFVPEFEGAVVERLRDAGAIIVGS